MTKAPATVTGVYTVTDPSSPNYGLEFVNTNYGGGPDGTPGVLNAYQGAYFPQNGDRVFIETIGGGEWVIAGWRTPNRGLVLPHVPRMTLANAGPAGWTQLAQGFADPATNVNPDTVWVPSSVVVPPPSTAGTYTQSGGIISRTYRYDFGGSWSDETLAPHQGIYDGFGPWDGAWFYPSMTAALSGKTLTGFRIFLHRAGEGGSAGPVQTHLYLHNHASVPGGAPVFIDGPSDIAEAALSWNASAWVPLPLSWAAAIQAGTAAGIGMRAADEGSYSILLGTDADAASGRLSFDYA